MSKKDTTAHYRSVSYPKITEYKYDSKKRVIKEYFTRDSSEYHINSYKDKKNISSKSCSYCEEKYLAHQTTVIVPEDKFLDHTLLSHATLGHRNDGTKFVSRINMQAYRESYYNKAGIDGKNGQYPGSSAGEAVWPNGKPSAPRRPHRPERHAGTGAGMECDQHRHGQSGRAVAPVGCAGRCLCHAARHHH